MKQFFFIFLVGLIPFFSEGKNHTIFNDCCEAPLIEDITVSYNTSTTSSNSVTICLDTENYCPGGDMNLRYRKANGEASSWFYTSPNATSSPDDEEGFCADIGGEPCTDYVVQVAYFNPNCRRIEYSESVSYTIPGEGCLTDCYSADIPYVITPTEECGEIELCLLDYQDCLLSHFMVKDLDTGITYEQNEGYCTIISGLSPGQVFNFTITINNDWVTTASQSYSVTVEEGCLPDCCFVDADLVVEQEDCNSVSISVLGYEHCDVRYTFQFQISGTENWSLEELNGEANTLNLTNLDPCENYDFSVRVRLGDCDENFDFVEFYNFSFESDCCEYFSGIGGRTSLEKEKLILTKGTSFVFPNPFNEQVNIIFNTESANAYDLLIVDIKGTIVYNRQGTTNKGSNIIVLDDLNQLSTGIYFYQIKSKEQIFSGKLTKL